MLLYFLSIEYNCYINLFVINVYNLLIISFL
jgi:hypothetical protein